MKKSPANILQTKSKAVRVIFFISYVLFVYLLILYTIQDDLFFYPDEKYISPTELGLTEFKEAPLKARDGTVLTTWYARRNPQKPVLLFFHGNTGQNARFAAPLLPLIQKGYSVMMLEYRGFAKSEGWLSQEKMYADAAVAYDYLRHQGHAQVIAMGYSMGCAAAVGLADRRQVNGLILFAPFESMERMVAELPIPFARYILKDRYPSDEYIQGVYVPLLIFHGAQDKLIPYMHSERLYRLAGSKNKRLILAPNDDHISIFYAGQAISQVADWLGH